ncbi:Vacuolar basic amino acid transporter 2 [Madurella mycetomatis]|uniref:Vacuolar basic amino acid transporter 2 n=1 Tax=Madurella mycetomatis TaxID=100816 RepID=A0A175W8W7_9PEZI|nr:Vacuolar basic amino acid transporter 2 [Madurella mycetomatis]
MGCQRGRMAAVVARTEARQQQQTSNGDPSIPQPGYRPWPRTDFGPSGSSKPQDAELAGGGGILTVNEETPLLTVGGPSEPASPCPGGLSRARFWLLFLQIRISYFVCCFDSTIVASSHPVITWYSYINITWGVGSMLGAALGGAMADYLGWRWEFGVQVLLLVACLAIAVIVVPPDIGLYWKERMTPGEAMRTAILFNVCPHQRHNLGLPPCRLLERHLRHGRGDGLFDHLYAPSLLICGTLCLVPGSVGTGFQFPGTFIAILAAMEQRGQVVVTSTLMLRRSLGMVLGVAYSSLVVQNALWYYLERFVAGPEKDAIVETVRQSVEAIWYLPAVYREQVVQSYEAAL